LVIIAVLVVSYLLVRSSGFQTWVANEFAGRIEKQYGGKLKFGSVKIRYPRQLVVKDVILRDQLGDTLVFIPELSAGIKKVKLDSMHFELGRIRLHDPYIQILEDPGGGYNYDFILEILETEDSAAKPLSAKSPVIRTSNARIVFKKFASPREAGIFNPDNFEVNDLNFSLFRFNINADSISFKLQNLQFRESCGFKTEKMNGLFSFHNNELNAKDFLWSTVDSRVDISKAAFVIPQSGTEETWIDKLNLKVNISKGSQISENDIAYFIRDEKVRLDPVSISGEFDLNKDIWDANNADLYVGSWLGFSGDVRLEGPEDPVNGFINTGLDTLWVDVIRGRSGYTALFVDFDTLDIPFKPEDLGTLMFSGEMDGKLRDFSTRGEFKCAVGAFVGSLMVKPGQDPGIYIVSSNYRGSLIHLDNFMGFNSGVGLISAEGNLEGTWDGDSIYSLKLESVLPFIQWQGYYYTNVNLKAVIENNFYEAALVVSDDNGNMELSGKVDLTNKEPAFDLDMFVDGANLSKLNLYKPDTAAKLDLNLHAWFTGSEIDDIEGQLWIEDSKFSNSKGEIPVKELNLQVDREFNKKRIVFVSEYVDGRMTGDIYLDDLPGQLINTAARFLPVNIEKSGVHPDRLNDFSFNINFKNPRPLSEVLASDYIFKENTQMNGFFKYGGKELQIEGSSPQFLIFRKQFTDFRFRLYTVGNDLELSANM
jgi:hypothetical protein